MKVFHRTPDGQAIMENGFRDGEGTYLTGKMHQSVWLSDRPLCTFEGAKGDDLLTLDIPEDVLAPYEWIEEGTAYREFLLPAEVVNSYGPPELCDEDNFDGCGRLGKNWRTDNEREHHDEEQAVQLPR